MRRLQQLYRRLTQKFLLTRRAGKSTKRGRKGKDQETQCFQMDTDGRGMAGASVCAWSPRKGHTRPRIRKAQQPRMIDQTPQLIVRIRRERLILPHQIGSDKQISQRINNFDHVYDLKIWCSYRDSMAKVASIDCIFETPLSHLHLHSWRLRLNQAGRQGSALGLNSQVRSGHCSGSM